jgi:hypothetical protein
MSGKPVRPAIERTIVWIGQVGFQLFGVLAILLGFVQIVEWIAAKLGSADPGYRALYIGGPLATVTVIIFVRGWGKDE